MQVSDQEYIARCRNGSPDDFRFLIERYEGPVFAFVASRVNDRGVAREVAQEAFVRAFFALDKLRKPEAFHSWLLGIAGRVALEFQRTVRRRREDPGSPETGASLTAPAATEDGGGQLDEAIAALPETQRRLILLRYFEQLSCQEIAERLNLPLGTVTKTLSRAYAQLRETLGSPEDLESSAQLERTL